MSEQNDSLDYVALRAAQLKPWHDYLYGNRFASVLALKGTPGAAELAGHPPFFGEDGQALENALTQLGWGSNNWCGLLLAPPKKEPLSAGYVRLLIEIIDPLALVALDSEAAQQLAEGFSKELLPSVPPPGVKTLVLGRALVCVDGFEAALTSSDAGEAKRRVWHELKALSR